VWGGLTIHDPCAKRVLARKRVTRRVAHKVSASRDRPTATSTVVVFPTPSFLFLYPAQYFNMASRPEMKEDDESGFCKFFRNLPEKNHETIRIFDRRDYYSAHGEDAKFIAETVSVADS
jgi:hypothetical protein